MLKGIETQTMITRATDFVREADMQQRKNDLAREYQAVQAQAVIEHEQQQVTQTLRAQEAMIHRDKQGRNQQSREQREQEQEPDTQNGLLVNGDEITPNPPGNYIIDIKI